MRRRLFIALLVGSFNGDAADDDSGDDLVDNMNRFAAAYNDFTGDLASGVYSPKKAARLSKLWRNIEKCEEWPREH